MITADLPELLAERLQRPLPDDAARRRLEPELSFGRHFHRPPASARPAAVLMLLCRADDSWRMPLVLRPATMSVHADQICLPGGSVDPGESSREAALRELQEELGAPQSQVNVLGALSPLYLFNSGFAITPWLAAARRMPHFRPSRAEVAQLLQPTLEQLLDPACLGRVHIQRGPLEFSAPCFRWQGHSIWGATSMMLAELLELVREVAAAPSQFAGA